MKRANLIFLAFCGLTLWSVAQNCSTPVVVQQLKDNRWYNGYVKNDGTVVADCIYYRAKPFSEGLAAIRDINGIWGFIDTAGNMVIKPQYEEYGSFSEGVCAINTGEGYAFIDQTGENIMGRLFKKAESFCEGVAYVEEMDGTKAFIDHSGKTVVTIPDGFTVEGSSSGGLIEIIKKETSDGIASNVDIMINHKGEEVWKYEWLEWVGYGE
jgi:hypothetical protein